MAGNLNRELHTKIGEKRDFGSKMIFGMVFGISDWILLVVSLLGAAVYYLWRNNQFFKNLNLNYDKPNLAMGSMLKVYLLQRHIVELFQDIYDRFPNDRYVGFFNFLTPTILVRDPELLRNIMVTDFDHFVDHVEFIDEETDPLTAKMVFAMKGDAWRQMRSTLTPAFTISKMRGMLPFMQECVDNLVEYLNAELESLDGKGADSKEMEVKDLYTRYTNDVIASCGFGIKTNSLKERDNTFYTMAKKLTVFTAMDMIVFLVYIVCPPIVKMLKLRFGRAEVNHFFRDVFTNNMNDRLHYNIVRHDMIHLLMLAKQGNLNDDFTTIANGDPAQSDLIKKGNKIEWSDDYILAQAMVFLFVGFGSSANLISFFTYEVALNPDVQKRLQKEIDESLAKTNGLVVYEEVLQLKYLDMTISETLRLWPGTPNLDRLCVKPYTLPPQNDLQNTYTHKLKAGDQIIIPIISFHRDPQYFKDPLVFDPERFSDDNKASIKPFTYYPFGAGPRQCLAYRFALMETKVLIVNLLSKFEFIRTPKTPVPMKLKNSVFDTVPENGFWVGVRHRKNLLK